MEPLGRSCPCFPAAGKVLRKGRCRVKGGIQRCCRPGGAGGRRAAPQTPQAPWFAEAGGPACNRVRTSMLWIHSPTPFSWGGGTLQCRCKLMCSRETERLVFLLRPLTGQVLSTKFPAASLQGQERLRWESQSVPLREGEVGTQAESPASTPALQRVSNPPVWKPCRVCISFGRVSAGSPGLETTGSFLPALGTRVGRIGPPTGWTGNGGEQAWRSSSAHRASPRVSLSPGTPVSAEPVSKPRFGCASTKEPPAPRAKQGYPEDPGGPDASFPPSRGSSSSEGQSQEICLPTPCHSLRLPPRVSPNGAAEGHGERLRFLVARKGLLWEKCLAIHWEICFEEPNEKSYAFLPRFLVRSLEKPTLPDTRQNVLSAEMLLPLERKVWRSQRHLAVFFPRRYNKR